MDHGQLSMVADKCQWVFSGPLLNTLGLAPLFGSDDVIEFAEAA